jgi:hypothetical protein
LKAGAPKYEAWKISISKWAQTMPLLCKFQIEIILLFSCLLLFDSESSVPHLLSRNVKAKMYKTIILPVVFYGCQTWSLTLREQHKLRVFENRVLRRMFGPKRDEVTGEWRNLYSGELHNLYSSPDIIRQIKSRGMRWAGHVARTGEGRNL